MGFGWKWEIVKNTLAYYVAALITACKVLQNRPLIVHVGRFTARDATLSRRVKAGKKKKCLYTKRSDLV